MKEFYDGLFPELGYPSGNELVEIGKKLLQVKEVNRI